jgi:hypothetical protein
VDVGKCTNAIASFGFGWPSGSSSKQIWFDSMLSLMPRAQQVIFPAGYSYLSKKPLSTLQ